MNPWQPSPAATTRPPRIAFEGISLEPPANWLEESAVTLAAPGAKPRPTLSLTRVTLPADMTLQTAATARVGDLRRFEDVEVLDTRETFLRGNATLHVDVLFSTNKERMLCRMLFVKIRDTMFVLSGFGVPSGAKAMQAAFHCATSTLTFGNREGM